MASTKDISCVATFVSKKGNVKKDEDAVITKLDAHTMVVKSKYKIEPERLIAIDTLFMTGNARIVIAGEAQNYTQNGGKVYYTCTFLKSQGANKYLNIQKVKRTYK